MRKPYICSKESEIEIVRCFERGFLMSYRDITDFEPETVKFLSDPSILETTRNPLYIPIMSILRGGIKTLKEIKEEYMDHSFKKEIPADKSLYRHLKHLKDVGLIAEVGKRVYTNQAMTEKLFGRTAIFFYLKEDEEFDMQSEKNKKQADLLSKIFEHTWKIPKPSVDCILQIMKKIREISRDSHTFLFEEHIEEVVGLLGEIPLEDLRSVVETYIYIDILQNKSKFKKELKDCLKLN